MVFEHKIPAVINPSGDYVVPLYIPLDPEYTALLLGAIRTLEQVDYYELDPDFDNESAKIVAEQWQKRTITPLIEAIASGLGVITMRKFSLRNVDIVNSQTQNNLTSAMVVNSDFNHTFEHPNAIIRCYGIHLVGSLAGTLATGLVQVGLELPDDRADAINEGTTARELVAVGLYSDLPTGVATQISLTLSSVGGQSTIGANSRLLYEIEEWD